MRTAVRRTLSRLLIAICLLIGIAVGVNAATITVNTLVDENNTNAAACSLREAINNANGDNTTNGLGCGAGSGTDSIVFSLNGTILPNPVLPTISTSMSITGNGASLSTIDGSDLRRVFVISAGTVSINNLTVTNGFDAGQAGAIYNSGGAVTLSGLVVSSSNAGQAGGIQNDATMIINNATITGNQSTASMAGGGGVQNYGSLTVSNSIFSQNSTLTNSNNFGGGIDNRGSTLNVSSTTFSGNTSQNGGALFTFGGTSVSVSNSTFINNTATNSGGGINSRDANAGYSNCTFTGNTALAGGGFIASTSSPVNLTNSTLIGNTTGSSGGGVFVGGGVTVNLRNTIVAGNSNLTGTIQNDISGNVAVTSPNNLLGNGGAGGLSNGVNGNQTGVSLTNIRLLPLGNYGGVVQTMPIRVNSPARNAGTNTSAPATDARGFNRPQATTVDIGAFEIQTNSVVTNTANSGAGSLRDAVANIGIGDTVQFETPLFDTAQTISLSGGQIDITKNMTIYGNAANLLTVQNTAAAAVTSRVFNVGTGTTVQLRGMTISGANSTISGGGIANNADLLTVTNCHITSNTALTGAGIFSNTALTVTDSTISNNTATGTASLGAGGIHITTGTASINGSTISGNAKAGGSLNGGGINLNAGFLTITNSTITDNEGGASSAGGVRSGNATTVRNSIIAANRNNATVPDVSGFFTSNGYNLIGNVGALVAFVQTGDQTGSNPLAGNFSRDSIDLAPAAVLNPRLGPLGNYGGAMPVHVPLFDSPAIDQGHAAGATLDQRGLPRPVDFLAFANATGGDGSDIGALELQAVPTAAPVSVAGRVLTPGGSGLLNAIVTLTDMSGNSRVVRTSSFGYFRFDDISAGDTVVVSISSKRYQFAPQVVTATENIVGLDFFAQSK